MEIKTIQIDNAISKGFKIYKIPSRGYSCITQNECLFVTRLPKTSYKKLIKTISNAFSPDLHLGIFICHVPMGYAANSSH